MEFIHFNQAQKIWLIPAIIKKLKNSCASWQAKTNEELTGF